MEQLQTEPSCSSDTRIKRPGSRCTPSPLLLLLLFTTPLIEPLENYIMLLLCMLGILARDGECTVCLADAKLPPPEDTLGVP